jgi:hypothetical protein
MLSATTTAPKRFEIVSSARIGAMDEVHPIRHARDKPGQDAGIHEIGCNLPPTGIFGAVLFSVMVSSNLPSLRQYYSRACNL